MRSAIFFRSSNCVDYEITVEHDPRQYVPKFLSEDHGGWVQDLSTDKGWNSLVEMSHDLKVEIVSFASDVGD